MNLRDMKKKREKRSIYVPAMWYHGTAILQNKPQKLVHLVYNTLLVGLFYPYKNNGYIRLFA